MKQIFKANTRFEILSPNGWEDFEGLVRNIGNQPARRISTEQTSIIATLDHRFFANAIARRVEDFKIGDYIDTVYGSRQITEIDEVDIAESFDIFNSESHIIIANDTISHQCD